MTPNALPSARPLCTAHECAIIEWHEADTFRYRRNGERVDICWKAHRTLVASGVLSPYDEPNQLTDKERP